MLKMATFFVAGEARLPFWDGSPGCLGDYSAVEVTK
jgi:hypothetical protein